MLTIDIVSDVVCPWCFIGKRRLEAALASLRAEQPDLDIAVRWHPYFLNPDTPTEGEDYRAYLEAKFGGPAALERIWQQISDTGRSVGIAFAFEKIERRAHTLRAHRLIHRAQRLGTTEAWVEALFVGQFQKGRDVGDIATLCAIGEQLGEDPTDLRAYLESDEDADAVQAAAGEAQAMGVSGVPFFIFNRRLAVSGAHPPEALRQAIDEAMLG